MVTQISRPTWSHLIRVSLLSSMLAFFTACTSTPSDSDGRKFIDDWDQGVDLYTVKSFTKTNGMGDEKTYTMEYQAEIECLKVNYTPNTVVASGFFNECRQKGQVVKAMGKIQFEKTENGWRPLPDPSFAQVHPIPRYEKNSSN